MRGKSFADVEASNDDGFSKTYLKPRFAEWEKHAEEFLLFVDNIVNKQMEVTSYPECTWYKSDASGVEFSLLDICGKVDYMLILVTSLIFFAAFLISAFLKNSILRSSKITSANKCRPEIPKRRRNISR